MSFNPLKEKSMPVEKQIRNWSDLNEKPYNKNDVHPYTRTRIILMNDIEWKEPILPTSLRGIRI